MARKTQKWNAISKPLLLFGMAAGGLSIISAVVFKLMVLQGDDIVSALCKHPNRSGNLCPVICTGAHAESFYFRASKDLVRGVSSEDGDRFIIKQKVSEVLSDEYVDALLDLEDSDWAASSLRSLLRGLVDYELEPGDSRDVLRLLWPWQSAADIRAVPRRRQLLSQIIRFAHNDEYKLSQLYGAARVFPAVRGTCGDVYAVERVSPLLSAPWLDLLPALGMDCEAAAAARRILQYLRRLAAVLPAGGLHLCDLKWAHFGAAADGSLRFVDLDSAFGARKMAATQTATACARHSDCDFFDCRGACDASLGRCRAAVSANLSNLCRQLVWPRVPLLGDWRRWGLLAHLLSESEALLLERCARADADVDADAVEAMLISVERRACTGQGSAVS